MKKVLAIVILMLVACTMAMASATNWIIQLQADSTDGADFGVLGQVGVKPAAAVGIDTVDTSEGGAIDFGTSSVTTKWAGCPLVGGTPSPDLYSKNFLSSDAYTTYPSSQKKWTFQVGGLSGSSGAVRFQFKTGTSTVTLPVPAVAPWDYYIRLVDNKGKAVVRPTWASSPGTAWAVGDMIKLTVPNAISTTFGELVMPELKVSPADNPTFMAQAYKFEFIQAGAVPEPSSLLVLGSSLMGLAGFAIRRRR